MTLTEARKTLERFRCETKLDDELAEAIDTVLTFLPENGLVTDKILTPAETRVAVGYSSGLIAKEIADKSGISPHTVVRHTQNIYDKAGIKRSTNSLVSWFLSLNYGIDLRELKRKVGAFLLFLLACFQIATTDFDSPFLKRVRIRRPAACKVWGRPRARREDGGTYHLPRK